MIRRLKPVGATIEMEILNAHSLDADPVCRTLAIGGALSAARTGDITIPGPTLDFSGATMTEVGGEGRVFHVTGLDGAVQDGSGGWIFIFEAG